MLLLQSDCLAEYVCVHSTSQPGLVLARRLGCREPQGMQRYCLQYNKTPEFVVCSAST